MDFVNDLEIRAIGLMRSGNHAILEWIQEQFAGNTTCFLNNVEHGDHDPYLTRMQMMVDGLDPELDVEILRATRKRLLIYSYEDRGILDSRRRDILTSVRDPQFLAKKEEYLGSSRRALEILILRDPFNWMASRLKLLATRGPMGGSQDPEVMIENWKTMAREAVALSIAPDPTVLVIPYNRWATDEKYRRDLSQRLGGIFSDRTMSRISEFAGGSSFDGKGLSAREIIANWPKLLESWRYRRLGYYWKRLRTPRAQNLKVFERWREFIDDETFRQTVLDAEVQELSLDLFGEVMRGS